MTRREQMVRRCDVVELPSHITAALEALVVERNVARRMPAVTPAARAARAARLALIQARDSAWWGVLERTLRRRGLPWVYAQAFREVQMARWNNARAWRDIAITTREDADRAAELAASWMAGPMTSGDFPAGGPAPVRIDIAAAPRPPDGAAAPVAGDAGATDGPLVGVGIPPAGAPLTSPREGRTALSQGVGRAGSEAGS